MRKLLIIGAGGHGRVCADIAEKMKCWDNIVFADDNPPEPFPYSVIGNSSIPWEDDCFISIGNNTQRQNLSQGRKIVTLVHPEAVIGNRVKMGAGTVVMAGAVINTDVQIGDGVIINTCASVDHDCEVGDYSHISVGAHLCGTVRIGRNTWIGAGAIIKNNVQICDDCVIGAGAVVIKDIAEAGTYIGIPARRAQFLRRCEDE